MTMCMCALTHTHADNSSYLFANVHCTEDSVCRRPGCYKSDHLARKNRRRLQRQLRSHQSDDDVATANSAVTMTTSTNDSMASTAAAVSMSMIDELRCDTSTNRCFGMGIEYNVFAMCKFLLKVCRSPHNIAYLLCRQSKTGLILSRRTCCKRLLNTGPKPNRMPSSLYSMVACMQERTCAGPSTKF
jgi:hypothetical protein